MYKILQIIIVLIVLFPTLILTQNIYNLGIYGTAYDIGRDNNGGVHLVWKDGINLYYGRIENTIVEGQQLIGSGLSIFTFLAQPRISVQPDGSSVHVTWVSTSKKDLYHYWRNSSGTWHGEIAWTHSNQLVAFPAVGVDSTGVVHIIAQRWKGGNGIIYGRKPVGGSWSWVLLVKETAEWRHCSMFIDSNGGIHGTWKAFREKGQYRYVASGGSLVSGIHYTIPTAPGAHTNCMGDSFVTGDGTVHHAFTSFGTRTIDYSVKPPGGVFGATTGLNEGSFPVCGPPNEYDPWPAVAASDSGYVAVTWAELDTSCNVSKVYLSQFESSSWTRTLIDNNARIDHASRSVVTMTNNGLYLVWRNSTGALILQTIGITSSSITIISPNGGEYWRIGQVHTLSWETIVPQGGDPVDFVKIEYSTNGGSTFDLLYDSVPNTGSVTDTIPNEISASTQCLFRISDTNGTCSDVSDNVFTLLPPYEYTIAGYSGSFVNGSTGNDEDFIIYNILDMDGSKRWRKNYGGEFPDGATSIWRTSDSGFIVAGWTSSFVYGTTGEDSDFLIYKLNANGNKQWRKNYGGIYPDAAYSIQQTADNGFIVAGETQSFVYGTTGEDSDFLIYKLDANGNKIWRKNYGGIYPDVAYSIQQTADGGFIVAGETRSFVYGTTGEDSDFLIYKLDADGNKQWRKNFGGNYNEGAYSIQQTTDGGFIVAGETQSFVYGTTGEDSDFLIYKLNADGNKQWRKNFGGNYNDVAYSIQQTTDGGFIVAGETRSFVYGTTGEDSDFLIYKLNANGNKQWRKNFGGIYPDAAYSIQQTADNGFIVAGETRSFVYGTTGEDSDFLIYKLNANGNKQWRKNFGGNYNEGARSVF